MRGARFTAAFVTIGSLWCFVQSLAILAGILRSTPDERIYTTLFLALLALYAVLGTVIQAGFWIGPPRPSIDMNASSSILAASSKEAPPSATSRDNGSSRKHSRSTAIAPTRAVAHRPPLFRPVRSSCGHVLPQQRGRSTGGSFD